MRKITILLTLCLAAWPALPYEQAPPPTADAATIFAWADDAMDDARTASPGARSRMDAVLKRLEEALTREPNSALLHVAMGRALIVRDCALGGNNCSVRAKGHLLKAIELDPKMVRAHVLLAHDAMNSGCLPCAGPHLRSAQMAEPTSVYLQEASGRARDLSGHLEEAAILYRAAAARFQPPKKKWQAYTWLSHVYKRQDRYDDAESALRSALESAPEGAWSNGNLGTFYIFARGDYEKAIPVLRKTVSIMNYGMARHALALAMYERWGDAFLKKADKATLDRLWLEAQGEFSDARSMFLISASYAGTGKAARALFEDAKVSPQVMEERWDDETPLMMATRNENTDLAVFLIERGANPNVRNEYGLFVAHVAAMEPNLRILEALARAKANLGVLNETRGTTLVNVVNAPGTNTERLKAAALLIDNGVPLEARTTGGSTALSYAVGKGNLEMVRLLLSRGARLDRDLHDGYTLTGRAILSGNLDMLQELAKQNLDLETPIGDAAPADFAHKFGRGQIEQWLRSRR